jgi:hypothetical protein
MRVLLDECVDESLRHFFSGHQCQTCRFAGFKGLANGELIAEADKAGFDVLVTVDQNLPKQQIISNRGISIVVLRSPTTRIDDLKALMPEVLASLEAMQPGQVVRIGLP